MQAARPKTLGAAVAPVVVGSVIGWRLGGAVFDWGLFFCTLGSCLALQVATNWFNDVLDFQRGADTAARVGPRRITAAGAVPPRAVLMAAVLMLGVAAALAVPLWVERGWPIVAIGVPSLYFCFGYTGGPVPLAYRGLGELFVILFFGLVAVTGSAFVQSGGWHVEALVAGLQTGCLSTVLIAINNLRDREEDSRTGKRTLAVRYGEVWARGEITLLFVVAYGLGFFWLAQGERAVVFGSVLPAMLGSVIVRRVRARPPGPVYNRLLAMSGAHLLLFALVFCVTYGARWG